jgi:hypothetical protein
MACSDVKLACCKLCKKPIASNLGECIHCGVCKPVEKEECCWWHRVLFLVLLVSAVAAAVGYERETGSDWDCTTKRTRDALDC